MIPEQLQDYPLIPVCRPECRSHQDCNSPGKRPVSSTKDDHPINRITSWVNRGGNYGVVARSDNDLVIFDSDSVKFSALLDEHLPKTFAVESGGAGHGEHYYYRCDQAERQTGWNDPEGSVRVDNWHCVGPSCEHPETGDQYRVKTNTEIASVTRSQLTALYDILDDIDSVKSGGGGGSAAAPSSHSGNLDFIVRDDKRREIANVLHTDSRLDERVWMVGWLHGAAGLTSSEITNLVLDEAQWPNLDRVIVSDQVESVIRSSRSKRGTHYSKFGTADMDGDTSERRKTEETGDGRSLSGGESDMADDNVTNTTTVKNDDGDKFARAGIVEVSNNGNEWEYSGVVFGEIEDDDDELGEVVTFETDQYGNRDYADLGDRSPDELRLAAEALNHLADEIED